MNELSHYVYAYLRTDGTPYYIGKGKGRRAWDHHRRTNGQNLLPKETNRIILLETGLTNVGACAIERRLIRWYGKKIDGGLLVNIADGGDGGGKLSEEAKRKISETTKGRPAKNKGIRMSEETRLKMSQSHTGVKRIPLSDATKAAISKTHDKVYKCPHCQKSGGRMMLRWHFEKCREVANVAA